MSNREIARTKGKRLELDNALVVNSDLTEKEKIFALEYINTHHISDSIIKAGYETNSPRKMGWNLLQVPRIRNFIEINKIELESRLKQKYYNAFYTKAAILWEGINDLSDNITDKNRAAYTREIRGNIAELNRMFGDYPPDKSLNVNVDMDAEIAKIRDLIPQYERGY